MAHANLMDQSTSRHPD